MPWSHDWLIAAGAYLGSCSMKRLEVFLLPLDGMLVHPRSLLSNLLGFPQNCQYPLMLLDGERHCESCVLPKNPTRCPRPGREPGALAPESSALTMRPPRLPNERCYVWEVFLGSWKKKHTRIKSGNYMITEGKESNVRVLFKILKISTYYCLSTCECCAA